MDALYLPSLGGGSTSVVGSRRSLSTCGVGSRSPKPSSAIGRGDAPTTHSGFGLFVGTTEGTVVVGAGVGVGDAAGDGSPAHAAVSARTSPATAKGRRTPSSCPARHPRTPWLLQRA